ncbi:cysteinyl-tRNA synthetase [Schizopora paradoxa]|uniref:cysteine--tRNA ligase n=1 Tax=Schizopora paradoxa TaxID=27342 RepID=A0A0H2RTM3_9AGAM|nr:cysteinyl-tRNA synthetase [Schizopora paradoxa]
MATQQPPWSQPTRQSEEPKLKVYNSLTKSKDEFIPKNGRHVKWYNCGPTVYDASHMGHARNYVTQDIIRRILVDYFGYDVHFVMNITDIDDKIINRSRESHLLNEFRGQTHVLSQELVSDVQNAWDAYLLSDLADRLPEEDQPVGDETPSSYWNKILEKSKNAVWKAEILKKKEKFDMQLSALRKGREALATSSTLLKQGETSKENSIRLIDDSQDILVKTLDKKYGGTVTDPALSRALAQYWEGKFFEDMDRLRVQPPDTLTRVTEYVPEIVAFVQRIIDNGFAYEGDGNVYFNTDAFKASKTHHYPKLQPGNTGDDDESRGARAPGQRSKNDFALWKRSKPGEPFWDSTWGPGRPGWHIECSVMASAILGDNMDIHSGGIDLTFPHHDNELAQSEAYHNCGQWVNYFIHTGHLHIEGLKMSKSLKNFITVDEALRQYSARQLRLAFLVQRWDLKVDFTDSQMTGEIRTIERTFDNYFSNVKAILAQHDGKSAGDGKHRFGETEQELQNFFHKTQQTFREALCDSFNTPEAITALTTLVSRYNVYAQGKDLNVSLVKRIALWETKMLRMFGLGEGPVVEGEIGWGKEQRDQGAEPINKTEVIMPYLRVLSSFRDGVRRLAIENKDGAMKEILTLSDRLRDDELLPLGVQLDDQDDGKALIKTDIDPEQLMRERDEKRAQADAKAAKKAKAKEEERKKQLQKLEKGKTPPSEMFKPPHVPEGTYREWDAQGIPLTDGEGNPLSKNAAKKAQKDFANQQKAHQEYLEWQKSQTNT